MWPDPRVGNQATFQNLVSGSDTLGLELGLQEATRDDNAGRQVLARLTVPVGLVERRVKAVRDRDGPDVLLATSLLLTSLDARLLACADSHEFLPLHNLRLMC